MLTNQMKEQLKGLFSGLASQYTFNISLSDSHPSGQELREMLYDVAECSPKISIELNVGLGLQFDILKDGVDSGVSFRAVPNGHEFNSLLLAILNMDGKGKNLPDEFITRRIKSLKGDIALTTYMSLTCTNCPDVVQALNVMAMLSEGNIKHQAVDGALYEDEVKSKNIQAVPTVYVNGELLHVGRGTMSEFLDKLEDRFESQASGQVVEKEYDLIVAGAGPAGVSAAIYTARKGLKVAIIAERVGGQINETTTIENIPSVKQTIGTKLASDLREHLGEYDIDVLENRKIEVVESSNGLKKVLVRGGEAYLAPQLIVATGAAWRRLGVVGESEYIGRGVAFCPHCDGPLFKDKTVAVVGGGNSGIEAAIDLAGICKRVVVVEFMESLKADLVLQDTMNQLGNVDVFTNTQTMEIVGDGTKVTSLLVMDRQTKGQQEIALDGVFVQIGLSANSELFKDIVATNRIGEIETDRNGRTSRTGIYAAGDVSDVSYKQIVVSMGEGAKAALAAFDDRIRGQM
ncbi:MAG: alkyl hydroperoxide reductase subunit F [Rikenellaceae bacterium]